VAMTFLNELSPIKAKGFSVGFQMTGVYA
jgi:hypothetical protein